MSTPEMRKKPSRRSPAHNSHPRDTDIKRSAAEPQVRRRLIQPAPAEGVRWETITPQVGTPVNQIGRLLEATPWDVAAIVACPANR